MGLRIGDVRRKVALGQYEFTHHAKDEMEQDAFTVRDIKSAIYSGRIVAIQRHGRSGRKLVIAGRACDGRSLHLVCRLAPNGRLRIITVFAA